MTDLFAHLKFLCGQRIVFLHLKIWKIYLFFGYFLFLTASFTNMPAGEDLGAKPKDYKLPPPPKHVGAAIDKLEHQEKALEEKLKTLTPKKILDDISLLKAQRDELKLQVLHKREMCEKTEFVKRSRSFASSCLLLKKTLSLRLSQ